MTCLHGGQEAIFRAEFMEWDTWKEFMWIFSFSLPVFSYLFLHLFLHPIFTWTVQTVRVHFFSSLGSGNVFPSHFLQRGFKHLFNKEFKTWTKSISSEKSHNIKWPAVAGLFCTSLVAVVTVTDWQITLQDSDPGIWPLKD